jgi:hypothetical protein
VSSSEPDTQNTAHRARQAWYTDVEAFSEAVESLRRFWDARTLRLLVNATEYEPPVQFELAADDPSVEEFRNSPDFTLLMWDVTDLLWLAMRNVPMEAITTLRANPERFGDTDLVEPEPPEVTAKKLELLSRALDLEHLRRRRWMKERAKTLLASRLDWDISVKHLDATGNVPDDEPMAYATLRIAGRAAGDESEDPGAARELVLTLDEEDVGYILDSLNRLDSALTKFKRSRDAE